MEGQASNLFTTVVNNVMGVVPTVLDTVTGNPILLTFFGVGIIGIAIGVVKKLKRA